jgi:hypothetical protein
MRVLTLIVLGLFCTQMPAQAADLDKKTEAAIRDYGRTFYHVDLEKGGWSRRVVAPCSLIREHGFVEIRGGDAGYHYLAAYDLAGANASRKSTHTGLSLIRIADPTNGKPLEQLDESFVVTLLNRLLVEEGVPAAKGTEQQMERVRCLVALTGQQLVPNTDRTDSDASHLTGIDALDSATIAISAPVGRVGQIQMTFAKTRSIESAILHSYVQ